jgi:hypothetical protein
MEVFKTLEQLHTRPYGPISAALPTAATDRRWQGACSPVGQAMGDENGGKTAFPDGIRKEHVTPRTGWRRHASPLSLAVFGAVIVLGLTGVLGHERDWRSEGNGVGLLVHAPETIRNGEFFEMRITVEADAAIDELAIGIDQALWEDITINTLIPAATEETGEDGEFRFTFGPIEAGTTFDLKVDAQINPDIVGGNEGALTVYDGDRPITTVDLGIMVLP